MQVLSDMKPVHASGTSHPTPLWITVTRSAGVTRSQKTALPTLHVFTKLSDSRPTQLTFMFSLVVEQKTELIIGETDTTVY